MSNYAITYFGEPSFDSPEQGGKYMEKWGGWISSLGDVFILPSTPLRVSKIVSATGVTDGARSNRLTGFSIVKADSMDAAVEMAKSCPHLEHGTIEVSEVMEM